MKAKEINDWVKEWVAMPEYNNINESTPEIVALFKFRNEEDYLKFKDLLQEHMYMGEKVFDGKQEKTKKNSWYPHKEKGSVYICEDET